MNRPVAQRARRCLKAPMDEPASPCNNVCRINHATGWCEGCWRTLDEIAGWSMASADEKRSILRRLARRRSDRQ